MAEQHIPSVGSHVRFSGGKNSGTVSQLVTGPDSDQVVAFIVNYGWRNKNAKRIPIENVKWVNSDNVVLTISRKQFDALTDWSGSTTRDVAAAGTTVAGGPSDD
jgi:uncharacterized protein YrrD